MFDRHCGPDQRAWAGRSWGWSIDPDLGVFMGGLGSRRGGRWRGGRMFEQGDLKFVILQLLAEKPRHGYDIIKELEQRSGGRYSPSAGTVYPTLTLLEEMGYAAAALEDGGKKVYSITDEGRKYLADNRSTVDDVLERLAQVGASIFGEQMRPAHEAMAAFGKSYMHVTMHRTADPEYVKKVVDVIQRATKELEDLVSAR
jgi:DNA-binding PadR family transcriptional regulator